MRVEPELLVHNKFKRLKRIVGDVAMECIITIWAHCQSNQRGGWWPGADAEYVEMLCNWEGQAGVLFKALVECGKPKAGFIEVEEGGLRIHDWDATNAKFVANWHNGGKGGRPKKKGENPTGTEDETGLRLGLGTGSTGGSKRTGQHNPRKTHAKPNGNPVETHSKPTELNSTGLDLTELNSPEKPNGNPVETHAEPNPELDYEAAKRLVAVLNQITGSKFDPPLNGLDQIVGRLLETNRDEAGIEKMLRRQATLWKGDPKSRQWLKPGTLFGEKFHDYYGQRDLAMNSKTKSRPRADVLAELATARTSGAPPDEIASLENELAAA